MKYSSHILRNLIILFLVSFQFSFAQGKNKKVKYSIFISDNVGQQYVSNNYRITYDSLVITGLSDNGKTKVEYLKRKITKSEQQKIKEYMLKLPIDSLSTLYFGDYANLGYISSDHYPRVFEIELKMNKTEKKIKINNSYVYSLATLFDLVNTLVPDEIKIKYDTNDFREFYK